MILAHNKPGPQRAEANRIRFELRFTRLKRADDIDVPHLSYTPTYQYSGINITETKYQHNLQA